MRSFLLLAVVMLVGVTARANPQRPNILFLIADDLGWADVGWHGSEINTPHLDRLAREGVILDQHYVTPMCSSTRACLLSGRYSTRFALDGATNSQVFPFGMTTLATTLQSLGYDTGLSGKWHLGSKPEWGPRHFGFHRSYGSFAGGVDQYSHLYKRGPFQKTWHRNHQYVDEQGHATDLISDQAIRWIETAPDRGKPWYIQVAFTAVHVPIQEPKQWIEPYAAQIANQSRRRFAACASHMDHTVGKIIDALDKSGQRKNTLIIFTSDNGGSGPWKPTGLYPGQYEPCPVLGNNEPLRGRKGTVFEGGVRVPAFVHWPGVLPAGTTMKHPLHIVDWMPTLLQLTGYDTGGKDFHFDGLDVWPLLTGELTDPQPRTLYFSRGRSSALRRGDWKLVSAGDKQQLFNLAEDPNEDHDLAGENTEKIKQLADLLAAERTKERGAKLTEPMPALSAPVIDDDSALMLNLPETGTDSLPLSGPPRTDGFGWIARGFWQRNGELLALASHFRAPGYPGKGLSLEAFRWEPSQENWIPHGTVLDDSLNNFPPKKLPGGAWMMSRRNHRRQVSVMVGGVDSFDRWTVLRPLAKYGARNQPEEPYWYILPDGETLVGLLRDNSGSKQLLRTFSRDSGKTWSRLVRTNFPDATSKFFALRTTRGYYVLVSNSNPRLRDPLTLAVSRDGLVYTHLYHLVGGRHVDYPHVIEQDAHLLISFSGAKQTVEVLKVSLADVDRLIS